MTEIKQKLDQIIMLLETLIKPQHPVLRLLNILTAVAGALGLLVIIDLVFSWMRG